LKTAARKISLTEAEVRKAVHLMRVLSNPIRLQITCALLDEEHSATELREKVRIKEAALAKQLAELRRAGILRTRRSATSVQYKLTDIRAREIILTIYQAFAKKHSSRAIPTTTIGSSSRTEFAIQAAVFPRAGLEWDDR
jgi:DNA-binding transcriptional ArsR family regulator